MEHTTNTMKLTDLCKKVKNGASSFYLKEGTIPLKIIRHADVGDNGVINITSVEQMMVRDSPRTVENLLKANDILIAIRGPMKVALVPKEAYGYSFAAEFVALEIDTEKIRPEIVAEYLRLPHINAYLEGRSPAKAIRSVSLQEILDLEIRVPNPEEQQNLVGLLSAITEQEQIIRAEEAKMDELKQSLLVRNLGVSRKC